MPRNEQPVEQIEKLSVSDRAALNYQYQEHWYLLGRALCRGRTVLDVGSGTGYGLPFYWAGGATDVVGIDPLPTTDSVHRLELQALRDDAFDVVTCYDVIEHVEEDAAFLQDLLRVGTDLVLLTTPNWNAWGCANKYHVREYTPDELVELLKGHEYLLWTCGKDRVASPVRPIGGAAEADAAFGVLLRGPACPDELWQRMREDHGRLHVGISEQLSNITRNAEEWLSTAQKVCAAGESPLEKSLLLLEWLREVLYLPPPTAALEAVNDITVILRYGLKSPLQQARIIAWALNAVVLMPAGQPAYQPK